MQMNMDERLLWRVLKPKDENYNVEDVGMNCSHRTFCYDLGNLRKVTCSIPQAQIDTVPINNNIFPEVVKCMHYGGIIGEVFQSSELPLL